MTFAQIIAILGYIVLIGNVGAVIYKVIKPAIQMQDRVEELERHDKADYARIQKLEELSKAQCKMLLVMIDHMIDGNNVDKMKKTRDQIIEIMCDE